MSTLHILKPSFTRWLSYPECMRSTLRRWPVLMSYFQKEAEQEGNKAAKEIYEALCDPLSEPYLKFLHFALSKCADVNEQMQSVSTVFSEQKDPMSGLFYDLTSLYMDQNYLMSRN